MTDITDLTKTFFAHATAVIDSPSEIGAGTKIWHFSHVLPHSKIGAGCVLGQNVSIGPHVTIGQRCKVQNNVSIYQGVFLEDDVFCGPSMVFTNVINPRAFLERKSEFKPTVIRRGATIGANATVLCGVTIGEYSMIGAGTVVTRDVPAYALVYGNPGRRRGAVCRCGVRLDTTDSSAARRITCRACQTQYELGDGVVHCAS